MVQGKIGRKMWPSSLTRQLRIVQWLLPLILFFMASSYETLEHFLRKEEGATYAFTSEVLIFGILGPVAVWWVLGWVANKQVKLEAANARIRQLNADLERRVAERTVELARKNEALQKANRELQALDRLKSEFVSLVSHELRAPLTNINGGIELIAREQDVLSPSRREVLGILRKESARLTRLVQNILDVSLLEAGRLTTNPGPLPLRPFLRRLLEGRLPDDSPHRLTLDLPPDLPPVWADESHLADVLVNLVDNAIKYSPQGGEIRVSARKDNGGLVLCVKDEGIGITPAEQAYLFKQFYRANNGADREVYGHGLGLYFCQKLVEAQGGRIWAESEGVPGKGSAFYVSLPVCPAEVEDEPGLDD